MARVQCRGTRTRFLPKEMPVTMVTDEQVDQLLDAVEQFLATVQQFQSQWDSNLDRLEELSRTQGFREGHEHGYAEGYQAGLAAANGENAGS